MNCDKELLVGYLYDELTAAERESFDAHVRACDECRAEVQELRATRAQLATWAPPEPDFGFRIIRGAAAPPAPRWRTLPAWGLAAAAVLVLAASAAIANLEVRYDAQGFSVRAGRSKTAPQLPELGRTATMAGGSPSDQMMQLKAELETVLNRVNALEQNGTRGATGRLSETDLRRVSALIAEGIQASENRQRGELALRITQLIRDVDASRASDLVRVQHALQEDRGLIDAELIRQGQTVEYLFRLSGQQK